MKRLVLLILLVTVGASAAAQASVSPGMTTAQAYRQSSACLTHHGFRVVNYGQRGRLAWWGARSLRQYGSWVYVTFGGKIPPKSEVSGPLTVDGLHARQRTVFMRCIAVA